jgi:PAS domain S-box-containing protein
MQNALPSGGPDQSTSGAASAPVRRPYSAEVAHLAFHDEARNEPAERAHIEQLLQECEKKFLRALEECPLAVTLTTAKDHRYIYVNQTFERISGWRRDEVVGRTPFDIKIWVDPSQRIDFVRRLLAGEAIRGLKVQSRLKNREVWLGLGFAALLDIGGDVRPLPHRQPQGSAASG